MNLEFTMLFILIAIIVAQQLENYQLKKDYRNFAKIFNELSDQYLRLKDNVDEANDEDILTLNKNNKSK